MRLPDREGFQRICRTPEDIGAIPIFILNCHLDYKLYLRHYSIFDSKTVLYAI